ncbi:MAG: DivIVA domain-containing protein [Bacilli bacterium]|nr:DivIVA domain-containing protein [Bacilli bacterium]
MEKFNTSFTGYKKEEVNKFIDDVIKQVESMINNMKSKDLEIEKLKSELEHYKSLESNFNRALLLAEDAGQQIRNSARSESTKLLEDAKRNADRIINNALIKAENTERQAEKLRRNIIIFKRRLRDILESQMELVDDIDHIDIND